MAVAGLPLRILDLDYQSAHRVRDRFAPPGASAMGPSSSSSHGFRKGTGGRREYAVVEAVGQVIELLGR